MAVYPITYGCVLNLYNWNSRVMMPNTTYQVICHTLSILLLVVPLLVLYWQIYYQQSSYIHKAECLIESMCDLAASLILVLLQPYMLLFVFFLRTTAYILMRMSVCRYFTRMEYLKVLSVLLEVASVCLNSIPLYCMCVVSHIIHMTAVHFILEKIARTNKGTVKKNKVKTDQLVVFSHEHLAEETQPTS